MNALKLFSILLDYPRDELWLNREELLEAADGVQLSKCASVAVEGFRHGTAGTAADGRSRGLAGVV